LQYLYIIKDNKITTIKNLIKKDTHN